MQEVDTATKSPNSDSTDRRSPVEFTHKGSATDSHGAVELISFDVRDQAFCVDIESVREIRGWTAATPLPEAPDYVCGIVNLRGTMLPIIDLAARLGFGKTAASARNAIVVVKIGPQLLGLMVDGVSEILSVDGRTIQAPPDLGTGVVQDLVRGILPVSNRMITCLNIESLMNRRYSVAA